jgi:hypothetical protein
MKPESDNGCGLLILLLMSFVVSAATGYCLGIRDGTDNAQKAAVKAGVGQWVIDSKTGSTRFSYGKE